MIVFELECETHNADGSLMERPVYWLGTTSVIGEDAIHTNEIYEQLDCELVF